tara:strand:- start:307 stop:1560 length:1254 start_codon:yes stop_codon:yes gene_type:complete
MAGYIGSKASVVSSGAERKKTFAITTSTTALTGLVYTPTKVHVFHNGVRLVDGTDFTATNSTSITLTVAAESGDQVVVVSYASFQVADAYTQTEADAEFVAKAGDTMTGPLSVTGTVTAVNSAKASLPRIILTPVDNGPQQITPYGTGVTTEQQLSFRSGTSADERVRIANNGDISFYEDTGTTPKFFWDASAESLGIGTAAPNRALTVHTRAAIAAGGTQASINNLNGNSSMIGYRSSSLANDSTVRAGAYQDNFAIYTGAAQRMRIDATGAVTMPAQPAFLAELPSTQTNFPATAQTVINFSSERWEQGSNYNPATKTFTAPVTGKYQFNVAVLLENVDTAATYYQTTLHTSNDLYYETVSPNYSADMEYVDMAINILADMDAGDTAYVTIYQSGGSAQTDINPTTSKFGCFLAC